MTKMCFNFESGEYEMIDESGFSYTQGEYVFNWDRSAYDDCDCCYGNEDDDCSCCCCDDEDDD